MKALKGVEGYIPNDFKYVSSQPYISRRDFTISKEMVNLVINAFPIDLTRYQKPTK